MDIRSCSSWYFNSYLRYLHIKLAAKYLALKGRRYCQVVKIVLADHNKAGDSHRLFWCVPKARLS